MTLHNIEAFAEVERLYLAVARVISHAYGKGARGEGGLRTALAHAG